MKKLILFLFFLPLTAQAQWQDVLNQVKDQLGKLSTQNSSVDIAGGLKEALNNGISKQVSKLTATDGFYKNPLVKITLPDEMQKVDKTLRKIGLKKLADDGVKSLNRAAEDAVKEATPIFVSAVKNMSFNDAKSILMGNESAATDYLKGTTTTDLYAKFNPIIQQSIGKVGADKIWTNIIKKYNSLPGTNKVNPDLTDYVTQRALEGVFKMIAIEEKDIRTNLQARSSDLLKKVFALQDRK